MQTRPKLENKALKKKKTQPWNIDACAILTIGTFFSKTLEDKVVCYSDIFAVVSLQRYLTSYALLLHRNRLCVYSVS